MSSTWSWADYERQHGKAPASPDAPAQGQGERSDPADNGCVVQLPDAMFSTLSDHAARRGCTVQQLVHDLLEVEIEGDLIDITLDGREVAAAALEHTDDDGDELDAEEAA